MTAAAAAGFPGPVGWRWCSSGGEPQPCGENEADDVCPAADQRTHRPLGGRAARPAPGRAPAAGRRVESPVRVTDGRARRRRQQSRWRTLGRLLSRVWLSLRVWTARACQGCAVRSRPLSEPEASTAPYAPKAVSGFRAGARAPTCHQGRHVPRVSKESLGRVRRALALALPCRRVFRTNQAVGILRSRPSCCTRKSGSRVCLFLKLVPSCNNNSLSVSWPSLHTTDDSNVFACVNSFRTLISL